MNRNETIQNRANAILASDPMLATMERNARRSALRRVLRSVGHWTYLLTLGGYQ